MRFAIGSPNASGESVSQQHDSGAAGPARFKVEPVQCTLQCAAPFPGKSSVGSSKAEVNIAACCATNSGSLCTRMTWRQRWRTSREGVRAALRIRFLLDRSACDRFPVVALSGSGLLVGQIQTYTGPQPPDRRNANDPNQTSGTRPRGVFSTGRSSCSSFSNARVGAPRRHDDASAQPPSVEPNPAHKRGGYHVPAQPNSTSPWPPS
jgi:hypothetical protein